MSDSVTIRKLPTQIEGFDQILQGGLPAGRTTLIIGGPGSGKSLFGLEFLYRGALAGDAGIFITFEERASALRENASTLGWQLAPLEADGKLFLFEARLDPRAIVTGGFSIQPFFTILVAKLQALGATRIVIDAVDVLLRLIGDERREQDELLVLHRWLEERCVTAVLTAKAPRDPRHAARYDFLDYLADCVIHLDNRMQGQLATRRLRVVKYRGSAFGSNEYPFVIDAPGITLLPISDVCLAHRALGERMSTGLAVLDELLGGGLRRASSILVSGSTGTGKTTLCSALAKAACARGESVLYLSFEESENALVSAMHSSGTNLTPDIDAGCLHMLTAMPEAMGAEQHLVRALRAIQRVEPSCVILESASACQRMGSEQAAFEYLMRLINICKERGITLIVTNQTAGFMNLDEISGIGISSLIDTVIVLRLIEEAGALRRKLLVMKSRGTQHSNRYHDFLITDRGIEIVRGET
ncbi:MAG: circadian clock protein KaiC [Rhodocyclaceae bacterium]|nr:circadian clock protein KaiC [Rhodocyclaceae bacterium]MDZ4213995.1 circadian clock protein KaiC [Rhodocyclaceae bacterium]